MYGVFSFKAERQPPITRHLYRVRAAAPALQPVVVKPRQPHVIRPYSGVQTVQYPRQPRHVLRRNAPVIAAPEKPLQPMMVK